MLRLGKFVAIVQVRACHGVISDSELDLKSVLTACERRGIECKRIGEVHAVEGQECCVLDMQMRCVPLRHSRAGGERLRQQCSVRKSLEDSHARLEMNAEIVNK